jgi:hypothetical protein
LDIQALLSESARLREQSAALRRYAEDVLERCKRLVERTPGSGLA